MRALCAYANTKTVLQLYEEAWSKGNVDVLDDVLAEGHLQRDMIWPGASSEGRAALQRGITKYRERNPDLKFTIDTLVVDVDQSLCIVEWVAQGISGPSEEVSAAGEPETLVGMTALKISDNEIVESRVYRRSSAGEMSMFYKPVP